MSDARTDLPDPNTLARQPGAMGTRSIDAQNVDDTSGDPHQALAETKAALEAAEQAAARERASATAANRERDTANAQLHQANVGALSAQETAIETAITAQTSIVDQAKAAIANAQSLGDSVATADAFDQLAQARANLIDLGHRKNWLATQKTRQAEAPTRQAPQGERVQTPGGPMDVHPDDKRWMDANPRFYNDPAYYNHALNAHSTIVADGAQPGSPAYYRALDERMQKFERFEAFERGDNQQDTNMNGNGRVDPYAQQRVPQQSAPPRRSAASMGAPPSRSTAPARPANGAADPMSVARSIGPAVTVDDLKDFAVVAGFAKNKSDQAGFDAYLKDIQQNGLDGLREDSVYR